MKNIIFVFGTISTFLLGCQSKQTSDIIGTSWYLFESTDSLRNSERFYKYLRPDLVRLPEFNYLNCLRTISFLEDGKLLEQAFHPKYQFISANSENLKTWSIKNDTLFLDDQSFLLRYHTEDSLIIQKFRKDLDKEIILLGYDTYYRIGI